MFQTTNQNCHLQWIYIAIKNVFFSQVFQRKWPNTMLHTLCISPSKNMQWPIVTTKKKAQLKRQYTNDSSQNSWCSNFSHFKFCCPEVAPQRSKQTKTSETINVFTTFSFPPPETRLVRTSRKHTTVSTKNGHNYPTPASSKESEQWLSQCFDPLVAWIFSCPK